MIAQGPAGAVQDQEPRGVALGEGLLGDPLGRKLVIEVGDLQNSFFCGGEATTSGGWRLKCS